MRHQFMALTSYGRPVLGRWKCRNCKMRVREYRVAAALDGEPCYGPADR